MTPAIQAPLLDGGGENLGTIGVRVVVLPRKADAQSMITDTDEPSDLSPDELLSEVGPSPIASYLERPKTGKLCCVFLVNGQRQEGLDNTFIVQQLGFKYLRKRMMIIVEVDGLHPEYLGELMQGSRQHFYQGGVWEAISSRLISTLKGDPDLQKLEEEAEAQVAELEAGDQKVKEALDTLIEAHHQYADHVAKGSGLEPGNQDIEALLGTAAPVPQSLVSLLDPDHGEPSDYPVLVSTPDTTSLWLKPGIERTLAITAQPPNAWPALASIAHTLDSKVPELHVAEDRSAAALTLRLHFDPPDDFDEDEYPIRTTLRVFARFNGFKEPRELAVALTMKPPTEPEDPVLFDDPTFLKVSTRQPVRLWTGGVDTHVRLRWNGKDDLALAPSPKWTFKATCITPSHTGLPTTFSQPNKGRFSLLVSLTADAQVGEELRFEIVATGPDGKTLTAAFDAIVAEKPERPKPEPRLINGKVPAGASRRPPYDLKYVEREDWDNGSCFGGEDWTAEDAGAYQEPTDKQPLTLLINKDMAALEAFRNHLVARKLSENEIQTRLLKYTSHVAYHLYQMYQYAQNFAGQVSVPGQEEDSQERAPTSQEQRSEIHRVSMTLLNLMQVTR
jgi:hypothetical protein